RFWVEDVGSRNGTLLAGLPIGNRVELPITTLIGLGESATVEVKRIETSPTPALLLRVTQGMDRDAHFLFLPTPEVPTPITLADTRFPPLLFSFREGRPQISTAQNQTFLLNGQRVLNAVQVITEDEIQVGDVRVRVQH
ncbi:MAG: hypothetical protein KAI47_10670, partial [Deltaproteobacteria bacterium]|nr:hypothetical protein [Deltaproteobacteria bacterium]